MPRACLCRSTAFSAPTRARSVSSAAAYAAAYAEVTAASRASTQVAADEEWARVALGYAPWRGQAEQGAELGFGPGIGRPRYHSKAAVCGPGAAVGEGACALS